MGKFENFLRPGGSTDTLAGRTSLDAFDRGMATPSDGDKAPAGFETKSEPGTIPVSRLIVLEDADHLGSIRQAYLRRMMEKVGNASRFILVARAPSRIIDALRSRSRMIRIPATDREQIILTLSSLSEKSNSKVTREVIELSLIHI